jgi:hypothetical protein
MWCAEPSSKESYRLCIELKNWKSGQGPTKGCRAIDEWMNECMYVCWSYWNCVIYFISFELKSSPSPSQFIFAACSWTHSVPFINWAIRKTYMQYPRPIISHFIQIGILNVICFRVKKPDEFNRPRIPVSERKIKRSKIFVTKKVRHLCALGLWVIQIFLFMLCLIILSIVQTM